MTMQLHIVTPEKSLFEGEAEMVVIPGVEGEMGVLQGHAPLITALHSGRVDVYQGPSIVESLFVSGGFAEVTPERCTILATEAVNLKDVTRAEAVERLAQAEKQMNLAE